MKCTFVTDKAHAKKRPVEPILLSFPQGYDRNQKVKVGMFQHEQHAKKRIVAAHKSNVKLLAKDFGSERSSLKPSRYLMFAYNKKDKTATLLNNRPPNEYIYSLKQSVDSIDHQVADTSELGMTAGARKRMLIETFGSQKKRREVKAYESNRMNAERVEASSSLHQMLKDQMTNDGALVGDTSGMDARREMLPEFNLDATAPEDVYPADPLVSIEQRSAISKQVSQLCKDLKNKGKITSLKNDGLIGNYVKHHLGVVASKNMEKKELKHMVRMLQIVQYMIFLLRTGKVIRSSLEEVSETLAGAPTTVVAELLAKFTTTEVAGSGKKQFVKTKRSSDKLVLHILVFCLHIENFRVSTTSLSMLAADLNIPVANFGVYFSELGCVPRGREADKVYALNVPLKFPDIKKRKSRR